jgi:hypothetical protein
MSVMSSLNFVQSNPKAMRVRGIVAMRQKLVDRIGDQIALAKAIEAGQSFQRVKYRRLRDLESDEVTETPIKTRVRPWWIEDKDGGILLWVKYGNQVLELQKGKSAIKVKSRADLVSTLEKVRDAARAGEFDQHIQTAVGTFKTSFGK